MRTQLPSPKGGGARCPYLLWPNGRVDQDATWYGSRPHPKRHCVRLGPSSLPQKGTEPPIFGPYLLWPNGWMDQYASWEGGMPQPKRHCVRWGHSSPPRKWGETPNFRHASHFPLWKSASYEALGRYDPSTGICTGYNRVSLYFTMVHLFPTKIVRCHEGCATPSNTWFSGPIRAHKSNGISIGSAVFAQITAECPCTLQMGRPGPSPQNCFFRWGMWTPYNAWFHALTQILKPNGNSIVSAVFAGLTTVTVWLTDRPRYSVGNNRLHLCSWYCDTAYNTIHHKLAYSRMYTRF